MPALGRGGGGDCVQPLMRDLSLSLMVETPAGIRSRQRPHRSVPGRAHGNRDPGADRQAGPNPGDPRVHLHAPPPAAAFPLPCTHQATPPPSSLTREITSLLPFKEQARTSHVSRGCLSKFPPSDTETRIVQGLDWTSAL